MNGDRIRPALQVGVFAVTKQIASVYGLYKHRRSRLPIEPTEWVATIGQGN